MRIVALTSFLLLFPLLAQAEPLNCQQFGMLYDIESETCVAADSATAVDTFAPLLGASGERLTADQIKEHAESSSVIELNAMLADGGAGGSADICNNGVFSDGCEEGGKRLCTLIPAEQRSSDPSLAFALLALFAASFALRRYLR